MNDVENQKFDAKKKSYMLGIFNKAKREYEMESFEKEILGSLNL